jgi:deazaflavin-dependent oxidoreductase (nitroreductase family)
VFPCLPGARLKCDDARMSRNPLRATFQKLGGQKWFATAFHGVAPHIDRFLAKATKGRVAILTGTGLPTFLLTTTGRKSGEARTVPLLYGQHGGAYIVTGSNWGQKAHPAWSGNLLANPDATVQIRGRDIAVRARLVEGEERAVLWNDVLLKLWPGYAAYDARAGRDIRVFALEPVG